MQEMQDHKITQISKDDPGVQTYCGRAGTPRDLPPQVMCIAVKVQLRLQWRLQVVGHQL